MPMPLLPPVTIATLSLRFIAVAPCRRACRRWGRGRSGQAGRGCSAASWWLGRVMTNDEHGHHGGGDGADGEDRRQRDAGVLERPGAEGGDAVAELVGGDHQAGRGRRDGDEVLLGEADRERQQRRAAEPGEAEGEHAGDGAAVGQGGDGHEGAGEHEGQQPVRAVSSGSRAGSRRTGPARRSPSPRTW